VHEGDPRAALEALIRNRGDDYASLSRLLGRNPAYVQQYIKRGTPRRLDEADRRLLARHFGVAESLLGGPADAVPSGSALRPIARLGVEASAGPGALNGHDMVQGAIAFDPAYLRRLTGGPGSALALITVDGESMAPTLNDGDDILIDRNDAAERLRDGIYVLRVDDALLVKRLAIDPVTGGLLIRSDNADYPDWTARAADQLTVVGRVIWVGRRIG